MLMRALHLLATITLTGALATALLLAPAATAQAAPPEEDSVGWSCAAGGNHTCGPDNPEGAAAGCYRDGVLVVAWTRYDRDEYGNPSHDPLWARSAPAC